MEGWPPPWNDQARREGGSARGGGVGSGTTPRRKHAHTCTHVHTRLCVRVYFLGTLNALKKSLLGGEFQGQHAVGVSRDRVPARSGPPRAAACGLPTPRGKGFTTRAQATVGHVCQSWGRETRAARRTGSSRRARTRPPEFTGRQRDGGFRDRHGAGGGGCPEVNCCCPLLPWVPVWGP